MNMKKLTALLLCVFILCTAASAYTDIHDPRLEKIAETLSAVGVIDGMGDGSYNPSAYLTREQFAKVAVCVLGDKEKAVSSMTATAFTDVYPDSWAKGYISYVSENGIIAGFPDGSFGGSQVLTYAQAVTVLLRCLGYSDDTIGFHWPGDYVAKAEALSLNDGLSLSPYDRITRGDAAILVYNAMLTEVNGSNEKLISKTGVTVHEDAVFYGLNKSDSSVAETSAGSFKLAAKAAGVENAAGKRGSVFVNKDDEIILFADDGRMGNDIVITSMLKNEAKNTVDISYSGGSISLPYNGTVYYDGEKTTASAAAADMTVGSRISVYYDDKGGFSSAVLSSYVMEGPKTVTTDYTQLYDLFSMDASPSVIRRGVSAKLEDISRFDVVYYAANTNTVYAYDDKVSGIYDKAYPIKADAKRVTVSGKEYEIASTSALNKLSESPGAFAFGDYVTLLLDRNGKVADVVDSSASNISDMGVLLSCTSRVSSSGTQGYYAKVFLPDGQTMEYEAAADYSKLKGVLVRIGFENGRAVLKRVTAVAKTGKINKELRSFGDYWLASDCSVLTLVSNPDGGEAVVRKIRFDDIEGSALTSAQVIHVEIVGEMNDVALMYLQNVSKEDYEYGVITKTGYIDGSGGNKTTSGVYTVLLHGKETSISAGRRVFASKVIGISSVSNQDYTDAVVMGRGKRITAVSGERIKIDNQVYKTAKDFDIYLQNGYNDYSLISSEDVLKLDGSSVELYGDRSLSDGGIVRLVIVK